MTLDDLLSVYNFREYDEVNDCNDMRVIRINTDFPCVWFEFGMEAFHDKSPFDFIKADILNRKVSSFRLNKTGVTEILLEI
jgi:hypothetical protein